MAEYMFHKFNDATQKLRRAHQHISSAREFLDKYAAEGGIHYAVEHDPQSGLNTLSFTPAPLNVDFLSMIGDAIHNMSSALDCATSLIVAERSQRVNRRIYFPTHEDEEQLRKSFEKGSNEAIARFVPELMDQVLTKYKPCGSNSYLWLIRKADNVDKHNMLIVGIASVATSNLNFTTQENVLHHSNTWIMPAGTKMRLGVSKFPFNIIGEPTFAANAVFGPNVPMHGHDVFEFLNGAANAVFNVLAWFERTFGTLEELTADGAVIASAAEG